MYKNKLGEGSIGATLQFLFEGKQHLEVLSCYVLERGSKSSRSSDPQKGLKVSLNL